MTTVPNYKPNVGRLVTDRFDFQKHINGTNFRHDADQIDLSPVLTINGNEKTNVQAALATLAEITAPPEIPDATTSSKGIIQLSGDISGTATNISVTKLQGKPISPTVPVDGEILTWNAGLTAWTPSAAALAFSPGGDLSGNTSLQNVIGITGTLGVLRVSCNDLNFVMNALPRIVQTIEVSTDGANFEIIAQSTSSAIRNGGNVVISGGAGGAGGLRGGVQLLMGDGDTRMVHLAEPALGRRILSLVHPGELNTTDMPADTGDMVIYIRDTDTPPTTGNPSGGSILYSLDGQLFVKQEDGNNFSVGSIPNPSIWGDTTSQTYTKRILTTSLIATPEDAFTYAIPESTSIKVDAIFVGKGEGTDDVAQFNISMGYVRNGLDPTVAVGTVTLSDSRFNGDGENWDEPFFSLASDTLHIFTGASATISANWTIIVQIVLVKG